MFDANVPDMSKVSAIAKIRGRVVRVANRAGKGEDKTLQVKKSALVLEKQLLSTLNITAH